MVPPQEFHNVSPFTSTQFTNLYPAGFGLYRGYNYSHLVYFEIYIFLACFRGTFQLAIRPLKLVLGKLFSLSLVDLLIQHVATSFLSLGFSWGLGITTGRKLGKRRERNWKQKRNSALSKTLENLWPVGLSLFQRHNDNSKLQ